MPGFPLGYDKFKPFVFAQVIFSKFLDMLPANNSNQIKHLYSRAAFGISYPKLQKVSGWSRRRVVSQLFTDSEKWEELQFPGSVFSGQELKSISSLNEEDKKERIRTARHNVRLLNIAWLEKMSSTDALLREKLTLFWHGHFACRSANPVFLQQLNNVHRKYALGDFRTMLLEVSRSPAMLQFLNNQQNRRGKPNENFARELMELFTLGRGNYTEKDIKEAARAFTGWGYNQKGEYQFRPVLHDDATKIFFGKNGHFDGTDIIDQILEKPQAANFIARKLYAFLVSDTVDEARIKELGAHFYKSKYDISELLKKILTADWFYESKLIGGKIKSPVELLVGLNRQFNVSYQNPAVLLNFQSALGQVLFYPPNVAGWPGGRNWIDSSSLMIRLKIPSLILNAGIIDFDGKADIEDEAEIAFIRVKLQIMERQVRATAGWEQFLAGFPQKTKIEDLAVFLLQPPISTAALKNLQNNNGLKSVAIELLSLPEYQMC